MIKLKYMVISLGATIALCGCETTSAPLGQNFGAAQNSAVDNHIVSKSAVPGAPEMHPQMVDAAIQRYLTDTVKQVEQAEGTGGGN